MFDVHYYDGGTGINYIHSIVADSQKRAYDHFVKMYKGQDIVITNIIEKKEPEDEEVEDRYTLDDLGSNWY